MQPGNPVVGGTVLRRPAIQSPNYVAGSSGWAIFVDGTAEFNNITMRGELAAGTSPTPRLEINPPIPAVLANWDPVNVIFNRIILWWFNATDFFFQGVGTWFGANMYMEGTYDTTNGPYLIRRVLINGASNIEERIGSYLLNSFALTYTTQQTNFRVGDGSDIADTAQAYGHVIGSAENGISAQAVTSGSDTTTSASYTNMAGTGATTSFTIKKAVSSTLLRVDLSATIYSSVATTGYALGVQINGVDTTLVQSLINPANQHTPVSGTAYISGLTAASGGTTYTVQARWKRISGTGTLTRDTNDWLTLTARELGT